MFSRHSVGVFFNFLFWKLFEIGRIALQPDVWNTFFFENEKFFPCENALVNIFQKRSKNHNPHSRSTENSWFFQKYKYLLERFR